MAYSHPQHLAPRAHWVLPGTVWWGNLTGCAGSVVTQGRFVGSCMQLCTRYVYGIVLEFLQHMPIFWHRGDPEPYLFLSKVSAPITAPSEPHFVAACWAELPAAGFSLHIPWSWKSLIILLPRKAGEPACASWDPRLWAASPVPSVTPWGCQSQPTVGSGKDQCQHKEGGREPWLRRRKSHFYLTSQSASAEGVVKLYLKTIPP